MASRGIGSPVRRRSDGSLVRGSSGSVLGTPPRPETQAVPSPGAPRLAVRRPTEAELAQEQRRQRRRPQLSAAQERRILTMLQPMGIDASALREILSQGRESQARRGPMGEMLSRLIQHVIGDLGGEDLKSEESKVRLAPRGSNTPTGPRSGFMRREPYGIRRRLLNLPGEYGSLDDLVSYLRRRRRRSAAEGMHSPGFEDGGMRGGGEEEEEEEDEWERESPAAGDSGRPGSRSSSGRSKSLRFGDGLLSTKSPARLSLQGVPNSPPAGDDGLERLDALPPGATVIGCAWDVLRGEVRYAVDGMDQGVAFRGVYGRLHPAVSVTNSMVSVSLNTGQGPFYFSPPVRRETGDGPSPRSVPRQSLGSPADASVRRSSRSSSGTGASMGLDAITPPSEMSATDARLQHLPLVMRDAVSDILSLHERATTSLLHRVSGRAKEVSRIRRGTRSLRRIAASDTARRRNLAMELQEFLPGVGMGHLMRLLRQCNDNKQHAAEVALHRAEQMMGPDLEAEVRGEEDKQHIVATFGPGVEGGSGATGVRYLHHNSGAFGGRPPRFPGLTGVLVIADPPMLEQPMQNASQAEGNIVLCHRGRCTFLDKARHAQAAGAAAIIIASDDDTVFIPDAGDDPADDVTIPVLMVSRPEAEVLEAAKRTIEGRGREGPMLQISIGLYPPDGAVEIGEAGAAAATGRTRARTGSSVAGSRVDDECDTAEEAEGDAVCGPGPCVLWSEARAADLRAIASRLRHGSAKDAQRTSAAGNSPSVSRVLSAASYDVPLKGVATADSVMRTGLKRRWSSRPTLKDLGLVLPPGPGYFAARGGMLLRAPPNTMWSQDADGMSIGDTRVKVVGPGYIPPGQVPERLGADYLHSSPGVMLRSTDAILKAANPILLRAAGEDSDEDGEGMAASEPASGAGAGGAASGASASSPSKHDAFIASRDWLTRGYIAAHGQVLLGSS